MSSSSSKTSPTVRWKAPLLLYTFHVQALQSLGKESNEVKTEAEVKAIKEKCERMELDFEVNGTLWNGNEGVVLFNLEDVWWLQQTPINPYKNISYDCVPPNHQLSRGKKERSGST